MDTKFQLVGADRKQRSAPSALLERSVPAAIHDLWLGAPHYQLDEALATAVNVALSVGAPLLLTGEPGTGKTQLAYYLAWYFQLGSKQPYRMHVKSMSTATDLLYSFDAVAYFHRSQRHEATLDPRDFRTKGPLWLAIDEINAGRPAIVLVDEIDKAPRDFPNDLLHELDQYTFVATHTREAIERKADSTPPVVVITSNSEKRLPPALLRRCVFHHIKFDRGLVERAVAAWRRMAPGDREGPADGGGAITAGEAAAGLTPRDRVAIDRFMELREHPRVQKKPATAELLAWLTALDAAGLGLTALEASLARLPLMAALLKDRDDLEALEHAR
jgi:MoxR-like ATPase